MSMRTQVALMTPDSSVASAVTTALQSNGHMLNGPAMHDLRELLAQLARSPAPIVLVDLDPQPREILRQLERIVSRFPASRFVALSESLQNELLLEAMQTGVRRVVLKQSMGSELSGVLDRLTAADLTDASTRGEVLSVLSASGGCGATTLAVNLAEESAIEHKRPALLCDLDRSYGAISSYLGLNPRYAADHVMNYSGTIDAQLIRSTATVHSERLHVLASPASVSFAKPERLDFDRLEAALDSARQAYHITVVDAPRIRIDTAAALIQISTHTLLVFQLTVKDLRIARAMIDALAERGLGSDSVIALANRHSKRQMIGLDEASKALGGMKVSHIRNDYTPAIQGLNFGKPLSDSSPRSTLRKDVQELLARLRQKSPVQT